MDSIQKLGKYETIGLVLSIISNNIIFNMPTIIFNSCGSGSWVNVLYISIISMFFMLIILKIFKSFPGLDIVDISKFLGGKFLAFIVAILYAFMFTCFSALCIRYFINNLHIIYFPSYSLLLLAIIRFYSNYNCK